ncbi:MAG TPA: hypothetical protein VFC71_00910 [Candidatus Polarisedimenticolia bacterium]|nr:hypothetical protein [Candidatus Polarisedimenticolia bacterium]
MDRAPIQFPRASAEFDPLERDIAEVDVAIELVLSGMAVRVRLANLSRPEAAAAHAAAAGEPGLQVLLEGAIEGSRTLTLERRAG